MGKTTEVFNKQMSSAMLSVACVKILLFFLFNVSPSAAEYSFIDITAPSSIAGKYGCMPTLFGSTTPLSDHILGSIVISDRGSSTDVTVEQGKEACSSSHVGVYPQIGITSSNRSQGVVSHSLSHYMNELSSLNVHKLKDLARISYALFNIDFYKVYHCSKALELHSPNLPQIPSNISQIPSNTSPKYPPTL